MKLTFVPTNAAPSWQPRGQLAPHATSPNSASLADQFYNSPHWWTLRASLMTALEPFPDARESLVRSLRSLHAGIPDAPNS